MFSSNKTTQKFIILLSDGVPNHAVGVSIISGGWFGPTAEERQNSVNSKTKSTMESLSNSNINLITMLTGLTDLTEDDTKILETVFGTTDSPIVGTLYNIADTDISTIIKEKIYIEVLEKVQNPINNVKIVDYFPEDITNNFEFSYVGNILEQFKNPVATIIEKSEDEDTKKGILYSSLTLVNSYRDSLNIESTDTLDLATTGVLTGLIVIIVIIVSSISGVSLSIGLK